MTLFARIASLESGLTALVTAGAAKVEGAAEDVGSAIENVSLDAFNALKDAFAALALKVDQIEQAIGTDPDAPAENDPPSQTETSSNGEAPPQPNTPAAIETTGS